MKNGDLSIIIVGVGGQGTLLASKFLGNAAMLSGRDVKVSEVHGMSQRGGSVITSVKIGEKVYSPVIDRGEADYMLSFEICEAARWLSFVKEGGTVITSTQEIMPMNVILGQAEYPDNILSALNKSNTNVLALDALKKAEECGSIKAVNIVLCGVLAGLLEGIPEELWLEALRATVPEKFYAVNEKAFLSGLKYAKERT
ncbi:MAG: indolepyruvate oxidoreductase subunit beta [Clostridia bacterium]|nr:indolepyruvate oxidoreductase subunit beta [Clostridia bacterium]